jgi:hypothetical protein
MVQSKKEKIKSQLSNRAKLNILKQHLSHKTNQQSTSALLNKILSTTWSSTMLSTLLKKKQKIFAFSVNFFFTIDHSFTPIEKMIDFCSESWEKLSYLNLVECRLDDIKLKELLNNA